MTTARAVTPRQPATASLPSPPSLSDALRRALADHLNLQPTPDGDGYRWQPPEHPTPVLIAEAKHVRPQLERYLEPAPEHVKLRWLTQLGTLTAGSSTVEEALTRIKAYARDLDHPAFCFTDSSRVDAARRFKFWPSFAELARFLDEVAQPHRERLQRLRRIGAGDALPTQPQISEAELIARRQDIGWRMGLLARALKGDEAARRELGMGGNTDTSAPPQGAG